MKMLVIDDHAIVRQGLAALLIGRSAASEVLQAGDEAEGLAVAAAHPDLDAVLLDLRLPGGGGMAAIGAFARLRPTLPVIILSSSEDPADVRQALDLGALGYVPKSASPETLLSAVRLVMSGEIYLPPFILNAASQAPAPAVALGSLTPRQTEVLAALATGLSNRDIGIVFGLSEKTVKGARRRDLPGAGRGQPHPGGGRRPGRRPHPAAARRDGRRIRLVTAARRRTCDSGLCSSG